MGRLAGLAGLVTMLVATTSWAAPSAVQVRYAQGSSKKICQITGEMDRERGQPTVNRTTSRFGVGGTDLGFSFEHEGRLWFLFGDTIGPGRRTPGDDSIAFSTDTNPEDCLALEFVTEQSGRFLALRVPGITLGPYDVPHGGFSAGGRMYVFLRTDFNQQLGTGRSVLASSGDGARTFKVHYDVSRGKFVKLAPVVVNNADIPGVPETSGQGVLLWGSGLYRKSHPYLAYLSLASVDTPGAIRFFAGRDAAGQPRWSPNEADGVPLFEHPCIGELSAAWSAALRRWLLLYNCEDPRGINMRTAEQPWGPWSATEVIFNPWNDSGYCHFIHVNWRERNCDSVHDPGRENVWGGVYGPYMIPRFFTGDPSRLTIYYVMSTWNPYQVVLMKSVLQVSR